MSGKEISYDMRDTRKEKETGEYQKLPQTRGMLKYGFFLLVSYSYCEKTICILIGPAWWHICNDSKL